MATLMFELDALSMIEKPIVGHRAPRQKTARVILGQEIELSRGSMSHMTQKLLAEKVQALLPEASARVKLTAQVISDLELGYSGALGLTVKQLRAIAHVLDRAFVIEQENIERPISIDGNTTLEMLFRKGVRLSLGDPYTD